MKQKQKFSSKVQWVFIVTILFYAVQGIVDPLYSLYVSDILNGNYFLMGVAFGVRSLMSLLTVFFLARLLQKMPGSQGLFITNLIGVFIALGFFLAGYLHSGTLIFIVCAMNGVGIMLGQVSKQSILMEETNTENASSVLGTNVAFKYSFWGVGMLLGGLLFFLFSESLDPKYLYLLVSILVLAQIILYKSEFKNFVKIPFSEIKREIKTVVIDDKICLHLFHKMKNFSSPLNFSIILFLFMEMTARVVMLFIPLLAKEMNLKMWEIFVLMAFMMLPMLFTFLFSKIADKYDRFIMIIGGILLSLLPLGFLVIVTDTLYIAIASAVISVCLALLQPAVLGISGALAPEKEKKSVAQLELFFATLGAIIGSMGIGAIAQNYSIQVAFGVITAMAIIFLLISLWIRSHVIAHHGPDKHNEESHHHRKIFEHTHFHWRRHFS